MRRQTGYFVEPIELTPEQRARAIRALAIFDAKVAALREGASLAEVQSLTWIVEILEPDPARCATCPFAPLIEAHDTYWDGPVTVGAAVGKNS